ncbi:hypothetical protein [Nocardia sp. NPDC057227]|uniref:hypothetical protein n=1 Tax=Nocardia sp. NPDC057227 TaxID=3346056 RepID=UPI00362AB5B4
MGEKFRDDLEAAAEHPVAVVPNICADTALVGKAEEDGALVDVRTIETSTIFTMPGR